MRKRPEEVKVLVTRIFPGPAIDLLKQEGYEVMSWDEDRPMTRIELIARTKLNTAVLCTLTEKIDKLFLDECNNLDIISQFAAGYDNIDVEIAAQKGIPVCNTPDVLSAATADVAFGLMMNVSRKMFYLHKSITQGNWKYFRPNAGLGIELKKKTLGIYGMGRIGMEMARRCQGAFDMEIIYHNRSRNAIAEKELGARYVTFDNLLTESDVISLHASLNEESAGQFDKNAFNRMKPEAIFINTARGQMHNEEDLTVALKEGIIWGAGLDVTDPEPMDPSNPLLSMENAAVLPHIGSATVETRNKMSELAAINIIEYYRGNKVPNLVNPGALS
ncbi:MAG: 2-hydroxyacid dehydrogenase [Bacteroidales bacterium]